MSSRLPDRFLETTYLSLIDELYAGLPRVRRRRRRRMLELLAKMELAYAETQRLNRLISANGFGAPVGPEADVDGALARMNEGVRAATELEALW